jgi:hypothetical protein
MAAIDRALEKVDALLASLGTTAPATAAPSSAAAAPARAAAAAAPAAKPIAAKPADGPAPDKDAFASKVQIKVGHAGNAAAGCAAIANSAQTATPPGRAHRHRRAAAQL